MSDDLTPDDPFGERLAARMRGAADPLEGAGVTRSGVVAAAVDQRRRQVRKRGIVVGVAACASVLGGLAILGRSTDDGTQHLASGATTTSVETPDCGSVTATDGPSTPSDLTTVEPASCSGQSRDGESTTTRPTDTAITSSADRSSTTTSGPAVTGGNTATTTTVDPRRPDGAPEQLEASAIRERDVLWAVYVDRWTMPRPNRGIATTTPDGHDSVTSGEDRWWAAETRVSGVGYQGTLTDLACEHPLPADGPFPPTVDGFQNWAVAVYFTHETEARAFADLLPGSEAAISHIRLTCSG